MRRLARGVWMILCLACWALSAQSVRAEMAYIYGYIGRPDDHDNYLYALLDEALRHTKGKWGGYDLHSVAEVPRNRQIRELETGGGITMAILGTAHDTEKHLRPVLIPVDKGLVGYRLLLIRRAEEARFAALRSPADLRPFSLGQNSSWDDVDILRANGLTVQLSGDFEGLFPMLARSRFDALPRGVGEIGREYAEHSALFPEMQIDAALLLHYPLPIYFWFARSPDGEKLAGRLEEGLRAMIEDGEFDQIFWKYHRTLLSDLGLSRRRVLQLDNPYLPADTPLADARLWLTPEQLGVGVSSR